MFRKIRKNYSHLSISKVFLRLTIACYILMCGSSIGYCKDEKKELTVIEKKALTVGEIATVSKGDVTIKHPSAPDGYRLELKGSDRPQVIDNNGNIVKPLVDAEVQLYYQLVDLSTKERTDVPNKKVLVPGEFTQKQTGNACPEVIPSLREWHGLNGTFELGKKGKIIIDADDFDKLSSTMTLFTEDLHFFGNRNFSVKSGSYKSGSIYVSLDCEDKALGEEGYRLTVDDGIKLVANTPKGIFMGTRTILQLANVYNSEIPKGITRDYPKYPRRGFMLDTGRKFFRLSFLKDYVRIMSYYKMNEFHIHLNDNGFKQFFGNDWSKTYAAFRLESETYPGLTAKDGSYSKKEFTALQQLGMNYGINVIPEIDIPAHSLAFTQYNPTIGSEEFGMDHLDITKQETYDFFDKLFDEYLGGDNPVFIGPDVHIGTDEYSKKKAEEFRKFTDHYLKLVQSYGKRARLWGALTHAKGETPVTSENVIMNAWYNGYADPRDMIEQGYELISTSDRHLYIVPAAGYYYDYLNLKFLFEKWEPNLIGGDVFPFGHPSVSGGMFAVWNDHCGNGISEKDVHHRTFPALQVLAQKMWQGKKEDLSQDTFNGIAKKLVEAPYINVMGVVPSKEAEVLTYDFTSSNKKDCSANGYDVVANDGAKFKKGLGVQFNGSENVTTPVEEIGYPYQVDFDVTFDSSATKEMILFSSENAEFVAVPENDKIILGFKRDGYFYTFNYAIKAGERVSLAIQGDNKGTALLVDGKEVERLEGKVEEHKKEDGKVSKMYIQQTLVFPLRTIGNEKNGFKGVMHQLKVSKI